MTFHLLGTVHDPRTPYLSFVIDTQSIKSLNWTKDKSSSFRFISLPYSTNECDKHYDDLFEYLMKA